VEVDGTIDPLYQIYFFGELIPPYVDVLGRGPHFRATDQANLKYQPTAKCYRNMQRYGSLVYDRFSQYYGPQYDIQMGTFHQGYGSINDYEGFFGKGSQYIDLTTARYFDAAYNCTRGFKIMNETETPADAIVVYTDPVNDPTGKERKTYKGDDIWYRGTCESDVICDTSAAGKVIPCPEGNVCDELTTQERSVFFRCRGGYVCDFATTPDPSLEAPQGQFKRLCPTGYYCPDGTGRGQQIRYKCPAGHFCPTGTADPYLGSMANDAVNRGMTEVEADPFYNVINLKHIAKNDIRVISDHDRRCFDGVDRDLKIRYRQRFISSSTLSNNQNVNYLNVLRPGMPPYIKDGNVTGMRYGTYYRPSAVNKAVEENRMCARDHKWRLVSEAIERDECDCKTQFKVIIAVYRLWQCSGQEPLANLGVASVNEPFNGDYDSWFSRIARTSQRCRFHSHPTALNCTHGGITTQASKPSIHSPALDLKSGVVFQYRWLERRNYTQYDKLKIDVEAEFQLQNKQLLNGSREAMDPYTFDLRYAVQLVEQFGERLEELVYFKSTQGATGIINQQLGRMDMCECQKLHRCPNGTASIEGAKSVYDCVKTSEVLLRANAVASFVKNSTYDAASHTATFLYNMTDFTEVGGDDNLPIGTIKLQALDVAVITMDLSKLSRNLTYDTDWQLAVYLDCKPCPPRYKCIQTVDPPTCESPSADLQMENYLNCLKKHRVRSCVNNNGTSVPCSSNQVYSPATFMEPDVFKCRRIPFFCDDRTWEKISWRVKKVAGVVLPGSEQEKSWFKNHGYANPPFTTPGCCRCERHSLPPYFSDTDADVGFQDNKHTQIQFQVQALKDVEVTVAMELLNGMHHTEFRAGMPDKGDLYIHTPGRANYAPNKPGRDMFMAIITKDIINGNMELPLNLPQQMARVSGTTEYEKTFENAVVLGRPTDLNVADPRLAAKLKLRARAKELTTPPVVVPPGTPSYEDDGFETSFPFYTILANYDDVKSNSLWWEFGDANAPDGIEYLALPYFPFFSNCKGFDRYMSISKLLEAHPDCKLIDYDRTRYVNQYPWFGMYVPLGDTCQTDYDDPNDIFGNRIFWGAYKGVDLKCTYEEDVENAAGNPRWYEMSSGPIFHLTKEPLSPKSFEEVRSADGTITSLWGRGETVRKKLGTYHLVDVTIGALNGTSGNVNAIPRRIQMTITYYQQLQGLKTLVAVNLEYVTVCTTIKDVSLGGDPNLLDYFSQLNPPVYPCDVDINGDLLSRDYVLEVNFYPLTWFELLNFFQFGMIIYIIFYILVGLLSICLIWIIYFINRLLTKLRNPPRFQGLKLFYLLSETPTQGVLYASVPCFACITWVWVWLQSKANGGPMGSSDPVGNPSVLNLEGTSASWITIGVLDASTIEEYRMDRMGTCFLLFGAYGMVLVARLVIPDWDKDKEPDNAATKMKKEIMYDDEDEEELPPTTFFKPKIWKRANFLYTAIALNLGLMLLWEFSYSDTFGSLQFQLQVLFMFIFMQVSNWFANLLSEDLLINQMDTICGITLCFAGMGAATFTNFVLGYFVGLALGWIQSIFMQPAIDQFMIQWPKYKFTLKRQFRRKRRMTREEKAAEEKEWQEINEKIELADEGIEPVLGNFGSYSTGAVNYYLSPILSLFLFMFYTETTIPGQYGINSHNMIFYTLFSLFIIPFQMLQDVVVINTLELVHGWKIYDYIAYQKYRFSVRDYRWILRNEMLDESIDQGMQTMDLMCFSSQYYFILAITGYSSFLIQVSIEMFLRRQFNPFGDPQLIYICITVIIVCLFLQWLLMKLANIKIKRLGWRGLWMTKQIEGTVDDEVAAKLAVGEGRQADLEQERLELQALNSERFRHRFVERNKPWILQHLVELITPPTLNQPGPEGRPLVEYIRDVYAELLAMGEGQRKPGDRSDISSDSDDEMEARRRDWPAKPVMGTTLVILRWWLEKARKRRAFGMHIQGIIQSNKEDRCSMCQRTEDQGVVLVCNLASNQETDPYALDRLISGFEDQYGKQERDANLWKAYFRANAEFMTRCTTCISQMQKHRMGREVEDAHMGRQARADDISDDEDDMDDFFEPMVISRTSVVGRVMSKWLAGARAKLGGDFPRPTARAEMERYVEKLRKIKLRKGRKDIAGAQAADGPGVSAKEKGWGEVKISAATKAIGLRWLRMARDSVEKKFAERGDKLRTDLREILKAIREEDDWFFGAEFRLEGEQLLQQGGELRDDQRNMTAEMAVKIRKIETDFESFEKERRDDIDHDRQVFETKVQDYNAKASMEAVQRTAELAKFLETKRVEFAQEQKKAREELGAASTEMQEAHRQALSDIEEQIRAEEQKSEQVRAAWEAEQRLFFDQKEQLKLQVGARRAKGGYVWVVTMWIIIIVLEEEV